MTITQLPSHEEMYAALVRRDAGFEGVFVVGVRTTGIFCRPTCPARKPHPQNVEYYATTAEAEAAGFRACRRCKPLDPAGEPAPWMRSLERSVESGRRFSDADLAARGLEPARVRRAFRTVYGQSFHEWQRATLLGRARDGLRGGNPVDDAIEAAGFSSPSGFRDAFARLFGRPPGRARDGARVVAAHVASPLGPLVAVASEEGLHRLDFADHAALPRRLRTLERRLAEPVVPGSNRHVQRLEQELEAYFAGDRRVFEVGLAAHGTPFQRAVWERVSAIPYGETESYAEVARSIGRPGSQRAVGRANGDNPLPILVPCHRVVRSDGSLCGYGGGLWRKQRLLELERSRKGA